MVGKNIIAHRGIFDNKKIPENSLSAIEKALNLGYSIEIDVQLTKDNKIVVFHDYTLERMTKEKGFIQEIEYSKLKSITLLDTKERIPTLSDVLKLVDNKVLLDIEIKNTKRIKDTCNTLMRDLGNYNNYILKSFNPKIVHFLKRCYPNVKVGLLLKKNYSNKIISSLMRSNFILKYCKPDFLAISKSLAKTKKYQKLSKKYPTMIWTIESDDDTSCDDFIYICNIKPKKN